MKRVPVYCFTSQIYFCWLRKICCNAKLHKSSLAFSLSFWWNCTIHDISQWQNEVRTFNRYFVTRENHWQIASLVTQKSIFTVTHALFIYNIERLDCLTWSSVHKSSVTQPNRFCTFERLQSWYLIFSRQFEFSYNIKQSALVNIVSAP